MDAGQWELSEPAVAEGGQVSLCGLPPLVVVQVLFGVWQRTRGGAKTADVDLRAACRALRCQQVSSIGQCAAGRVPGKPARSLLNALARHVRRALADPASEQVKDVWDLAVFGHPGRLSFTGIAQPWLRQAARRWAAEELPRHRGTGATNVRAKINALAWLSESLRSRPDHGDRPAALGRADIENFLARLGYLESAGTISRYHRNVICRGARAVLAGIRAPGPTRPGQAAAGLPGDVIIGAADIPAEAERGEPGRDLPPEIMTALCASLDALQPASAGLKLLDGELRTFEFCTEEQAADRLRPYIWQRAAHGLQAQKTGGTRYLQDGQLRRDLPDRNDQARLGSYQEWQKFLDDSVANSLITMLLCAVKDLWGLISAGGGLAWLVLSRGLEMVGWGRAAGVADKTGTGRSGGGQALIRSRPAGQ